MLNFFSNDAIFRWFGRALAPIWDLCSCQFARYILILMLTMLTMMVTIVICYDASRVYRWLIWVDNFYSRPPPTAIALWSVPLVWCLYHHIPLYYCIVFIITSSFCHIFLTILFSSRNFHYIFLFYSCPTPTAITLWSFPFAIIVIFTNGPSANKLSFSHSMCLCSTEQILSSSLLCFFEFFFTGPLHCVSMLHSSQDRLRPYKGRLQGPHAHAKHGLLHISI